MNRKSNATRGLTVLAFTLVLLALTACSRTDPEKALRASIAEMEAAVKARDNSKLMSYLAPDFSRSGSGGMSKDEAKRTVAAVFLTNPNIYLNATIREVNITGSTATARITVVAGGGSGIIPERAQSWDFTTRWRYEKDKWFVERADWTELL
ncbi:MAG: nuclear transport factor 2 family protein [Casimicrobium sp.]